MTSHASSSGDAFWPIVLTWWFGSIHNTHNGIVWYATAALCMPRWRRVGLGSVTKSSAVLISFLRSGNGSSAVRSTNASPRIFLIVARASNLWRKCGNENTERRLRFNFLNGAVVALGDHCGVPTPVNSALVALIKHEEAAVIAGHGRKGTSAAEMCNAVFREAGS